MKSKISIHSKILKLKKKYHTLYPMSIYSSFQDYGVEFGSLNYAIIDQLWSLNKNFNIKDFTKNGVIFKI